MQGLNVNPAQISRHARGLPPIWEAMARYGLTMQDCIRGTGVTEAQANGEESGFTLEQEFALYRNLLKLTDDPMLGLTLGAAYMPETYGILGYAQLSANNLRELVALNCEFAELTYSHFRFRTAEKPGLFGTLYELAYPIPDDLFQVYSDRDIEAGVTLLSSIGIDRSVIEEVHFVYEDGNNLSAYEDHFDCTVRQGQPVNAIWVNNSVRDHKLPWSNEEAAARCRKVCEDLLEEIHSRGSLKGKIVNLLIKDIGEFPGLEVVAARLGYAPRTLRRKLTGEGTSFHEILKEVRLQLAIQYLSSGLSVERIAELLGYAEMSSFSRAFKQWTGLSPQQFRRNR